MSEIPQWAWDRATEMANAEGETGPVGVLKAFARYIASHEEAPVDPLLVEARKLLAEDHLYHGFQFFDHGTLCKSGAGNEAIMAGKLDGNAQLARYHVALKRGMELAGPQGKEVW